VATALAVDGRSRRVDEVRVLFGTAQMGRIDTVVGSVGQSLVGIVELAAVVGGRCRQLGDADE